MRNVSNIKHIQARDLMNWAAGLRATMSTEEKVRDAASAQTLKAEHDALKGEIEAREENFSSVLDLGEAMVQTGHYAATVSSSIIISSCLFLRIICGLVAFRPSAG